MSSFYSYRPLLKKYIEKIKPSRVLEWGTGESTRLISELLPNSEIISCENNRAMYELWKDKLDKVKILHLNVDCGPSVNFNETGYEYSDIWDHYIKPPIEGLFDLIFVDGRQRVKCMEHSISLLSDKGVLLLHDSERDRYKEGIKLFNVIEDKEGTICLQKK